MGQLNEHQVELIAESIDMAKGASAYLYAAGAENFVNAIEVLISVASAVVANNTPTGEKVEIDDENF